MNSDKRKQYKVSDDLKKRVHQDFHPILKFPPVNVNSKLNLAFSRTFARVTWFFSSPLNGVKINKTTHSVEGAEFTIEHFVNENVTGERPCLIYYPGGGFSLPAFAYLKDIMSQYALGSECDVIFVNYSLAPENKSTVILGQCYKALEWVIENYQQLSINKNMIAVGGDSAGGLAAASTALYATDKFGDNSLCGQLLIYPVTDNSLSTQSVKDYHYNPLWSGKSTEEMWVAFLDDGKNEYTLPMYNTNIGRLPSSYIETAEFDPLTDEGEIYFNKLLELGVNATLNKTKGTVHGYDSTLKSEVTAENIAKRIEFLRSAFKKR